MLTIGSTIKNYRIEKMRKGTVFAVNSDPDCPEPCVVWDLDFDKCGVNNGRYSVDRDTALSKFYSVVAAKGGL